MCQVLVPEGFGQDVCTKLSLRPSPPVSPPIRKKHPSNQEGTSHQHQESLQPPPQRKRRNTEPPGEWERVGVMGERRRFSVMGEGGGLV